MWWLLAFVSAALLGCYDSAKKISLKDNAVIPVLFLNTVLSALIFSPFLFATGFGGWEVQKYILLKSALVLSSWLAGYFAMKHLPLTIVRKEGRHPDGRQMACVPDHRGHPGRGQWAV